MVSRGLSQRRRARRLRAGTLTRPRQTAPPGTRPRLPRGRLETGRLRTPPCPRVSERSGGGFGPRRSGRRVSSGSRPWPTVSPTTRSPRRRRCTTWRSRSTSLVSPSTPSSPTSGISGSRASIPTRRCRWRTGSPSSRERSPRWWWPVPRMAASWWRSTVRRWSRRLGGIRLLPGPHDVVYVRDGVRRTVRVLLVAGAREVVTFGAEEEERDTDPLIEGPGGRHRRRRRAARRPAPAFPSTRRGRGSGSRSVALRRRAWRSSARGSGRSRRSESLRRPPAAAPCPDGTVYDPAIEARFGRLRTATCSSP